MHILQRTLKLRTTCTNAVRYYSSSIDPKEIQHHDNLAENWWDSLNGPLKPLHAMNNIRVPFVRNGLINVGQIREEDCDKSNYLKGFKILDVGCGGGILSLPLARLGGDVTGLDPSSKVIDVAKNYAKKQLKPEATLQFVASSIEEYSQINKNSYDVVVLSEVLEHVLEKKAFVQACVDSLKPGGSFFITTINRTYQSWLIAILLAEKVFRKIPKGQHEWSKLVTVDEVQNYLSNANCKILQVSGLKYSPLTNVWDWSSSKAVFYAVHAIK